MCYFAVRPPAPINAGAVAESLAHWSRLRACSRVGTIVTVHLLRSSDTCATSGFVCLGLLLGPCSWKR
eukprot:8987968-Pyramimonas_sp.AAC.1